MLDWSYMPMDLQWHAESGRTNYLIQRRADGRFYAFCDDDLLLSYPTLEEAKAAVTAHERSIHPRGTETKRQ